MDEESIFVAAIERPPTGEREAFLDGACHGDAQLRGRVEALIRSHEEAGTFLNEPAAPAATCTFQMERPGTLIGPYKLREQVGEGGFGVVYVAEQTEPVRRKVALKIIKPGMDSKDVIARFEAERQALALMDHPNVARVLDVGATESGRPYFVMELVHGIAIAEFCDQQKLSTRERLEIFVDVCRAVQHAHQKGIIHRDLKPSNIMITLHDGRPVPKVIDFGVAKALSRQLTEKTVYTAYGQMVGTPLYMSPEQVEMSGLDIDTRSDVYSLGVLLYELLTGTTPFDKETLHKAGYDEMRRIIREDDPPRPSARVDTLDAASLSTVSDQRKVDPRKLGQSFRGELDWIVMKALEKDRNRRYASANELASDVERFLNDETVQACPPSASYQIAKFVRRHKATITTAALVALTLVLGIIGTATQAMRADSARIAVEAESRETTRLLVTTWLERGQSLAEHGDCATGMLWMARSLQTAPPEADELRRAIRRNLAAWSEQLPTLRQVLDHQSPVRAVCFSPDGTRVLTAGDNRVAQIWDVASGQRVGDLAGHEAEIVSAAWSPNGKLLATGSKDATARLWDATTLAPVGEPFRMPRAMFKHDGVEYANAVWAVAFSPDSSKIVAGAAISTAHLWDIETHAEIGRTMGGHHSSVTAVAFSPDGERIVTGCLRDGARIWDGATCELLGELKVGRAVTFVGFNDDGSRIFTGAHGPGYIDVWDAVTFGHLKQLVRPGPISAAAYCSSNATFLTSQEFATSARIWNAETGRACPGVLRHRDRIRSVAVSADASCLLTGSLDGTARLWDSPSGGPASRMLGGNSMVLDAAFSPDGSRVVTGGNDGCLRVWSVRTGELLGGPLEHDPDLADYVISVAFSPDGSKLVSGNNGRTARIWNAHTLTPIGEYLHHKGQRIVVAFSPDSRHVLTGCSDGAAQLWDADTAVRVGEAIQHEQAVAAVAFTAGGAMMTATSDGTVRRFDAASGSVSGTVLQGQGAVRFSDDGAWIATNGPDGFTQLWDVHTGTLVGSTVIGNHLPPSLEHGILAISPDSSLLLAAVVLSDPGALVEETAVTFVDAASGLRIGPYLPYSGQGIRTAAFSPDGSSVIVAGEGPSELWPVPAGEIGGDDGQIALWTQVMTGMELNDGDVIRVLDGASWQQRRKRLQKLGGVPERIRVVTGRHRTHGGSGA